MYSLNDVVNGKKVEFLSKPPWGMKITGVGGYVPGRPISNKHLARWLRIKGRTLPEDLRKKMTDTNDEWIRDRTGIMSRHWTRGKDAPSDLAIRATNKALESAILSWSSMEFVLTGTVFGDFLGSPSTGADIIGLSEIETIGYGEKYPEVIKKSILAPDIGNACSSFGSALTLGFGLISSGVAKRGLIIGVDSLERLVNPLDRNFLVLAGSGAGAIVVEAVPYDQTSFRPEWIFNGTEPKHGDKIRCEYGGAAKPLTPEMMREIAEKPWWRPDKVQQAGDAVMIYMKRFVGRVLIPEILERTRLKLSDIQHIIPHQANQRIIDAVIQQIKTTYKLGPDDPLPNFLSSIEQYANTSAATLPLTLDLAIRRERANEIAAIREGRQYVPVLKEEDLCLFLAFGGGYTWSAILFTYTGVLSRSLQEQDEYECALLAA